MQRLLVRGVRLKVCGCGAEARSFVGAGSGLTGRKAVATLGADLSRYLRRTGGSRGAAGRGGAVPFCTSGRCEAGRRLRGGLRGGRCEQLKDASGVAEAAAALPELADLKLSFNESAGRGRRPNDSRSRLLRRRRRVLLLLGRFAARARAFAFARVCGSTGDMRLVVSPEVRRNARSG